MRPTETAYSELQKAYDFFNQEIFSGELPEALITLQREKKTYGYFSAERFANKSGKVTDEIAMNPAYFRISPPEEIMQTLVHEMVHLWQYHFGRPGRKGYHNKEWADKMESIGLMPSSTGQEGGKRTGDRMSDYPLPEGRFEQLCNKLIDENFKISWADKFPAYEKIKEAIENDEIDDICDDLASWGIEIDEDGELRPCNESKQTRAKYTCPECGVNAWGKYELLLICGTCDLEMLQQET